MRSAYLSWLKIYKTLLDLNACTNQEIQTFVLSEFMGRLGRIFSPAQYFSSFPKAACSYKIAYALGQVHQGRTAICFGD